MFHLVWYVLIGLISGVIAKSVMHVHITIFWTIVLGDVYKRQTALFRVIGRCSVTRRYPLSLRSAIIFSRRPCPVSYTHLSKQ